MDASLQTPREELPQRRAPYSTLGDAQTSPSDYPVRPTQRDAAAASIRHSKVLPMPPRRLAALLASAAAAAGAAVDGHAVEGKIKLPLKLLQEGDLRTTEVTLNGGEHRAFTRPDGSFRFSDVAPGVYLLDVLSTEYLFSQFKLNLPEDDSEIRVLEYMYPGANKRAAAYPVDLRPHVKLEYFDKRQQPGLHTLFRNPMLLMMGFTMLMVFFMPKLMDSLDPEERKRMEEQMSNSSDPQKMIKGLFGLSDEKESDSEDEGSKGGGKKKRR